MLWWHCPGLCCITVSLIVPLTLLKCQRQYSTPPHPTMSNNHITIWLFIIYLICDRTQRLTPSTPSGQNQNQSTLFTELFGFDNLDSVLEEIERELGAFTSDSESIPRVVRSCTVPYCAALRYTVLYCSVLHCAVPYCAALCCTALCRVVLYCVALRSVLLYGMRCVVLCYPEMRRVVLHCDVPCCTVL